MNKNLKLYWGLGIHDNHFILPKRIIPGRIKYPGNKVSVIDFREILGEDLNDLRAKLHEDVDYFFSELDERLKEKFNVPKEESVELLHSHRIGIDV
ncbi:MAG: hypothetical protein AABY22_05260 [Nanoarchaeota archaeon]